MIEWSDSIKTGHPPIDADHCGLVALLNKMERDLHARTAADSIRGSILELRDYVNGHFAREEAYMLEVSCPAYSRNRDEHARFALRLEAWVARLEAEGPSLPLAFDVYHGTANWITGHIVGTDCELRDCPRGRLAQTIAPTG